MSNSEPPEAPNRRKVALLWISFMTLLLGLTSGFWFFRGSLDAFALMAGVCGLYAVFRSFVWRNEESAQEASRARVREAEQGLENALRGDYVTRRGAGRVLITRDAPPGPREDPVPDESQIRLTLSELWKVTHRRLDHYHGIALGQARQSFRNAQIAMGLGFTLLIAFVIVAFNASTTAGTVVAGGLGAVSAVLAGYISRTFIRSQEAAAGHLRAYFDQPLEFSRYLAAERLMADAGLSDEKRAEVLSLLVQAMIAGPSGTVLASTAEEQSRAS
ncbi:hypothetical protein [Streptomyces sp. NPDC017202]|uniref:TRADD-N-associated membrane domain-containing protein n=1 Tax=Streptomyces sp. NPDC017202 TaxID=3364981 RepID=UPI0037A49F1D